MNCPTCGNSLRPEARFCTKCGATICVAPPNEIPASQQSMQGVPIPPPQFASGAPRSMPVPPPPPPQSFRPLDTAPLPLDAPPDQQHKTSPFIHITIFIVVVGVLSAAVFFMKNASGPTTPVSGLITDSKYKYSFTLPASGWLQSEKPDMPLPNITAQYVYGKKKPHDIRLIILFESIFTEIPATLPQEVIMSAEPAFVLAAEKIVAREGYKYEHIKMTPYQMNGRPGIWLEGNAKKGKLSIRTFIFLAFQGNRAFDLWFSFDEKNTAKYWPEVKSIVDSFKME